LTPDFLTLSCVDLRTDAQSTERKLIELDLAVRLQLLVLGYAKAATAVARRV
jgi:hypothetical protein